MRRLSLVRASGGCSLGVECRLLVAVASLVAEHGLYSVQELQHTGLAAPWHMGVSWARDRTRVLYIGRHSQPLDPREPPNIKTDLKKCFKETFSLLLDIL